MDSSYDRKELVTQTGTPKINELFKIMGGGGERKWEKVDLTQHPENIVYSPGVWQLMSLSCKNISLLFLSSEMKYRSLFKQRR